MIEMSASVGALRRFLFQGISFLLVCALGGTFNFVNTPFSLWIQRVSSFPEEEEVYAKDRSALVSAAQPSRRGTIRPKSIPPQAQARLANSRAETGLPSSGNTFNHILMGAGIFQRC